MSANIASVDEESLRSDLRELVRKTVQETLNALLDEEADEMVGAGRYERAAAREAHPPRRISETPSMRRVDTPARYISMIASSTLVSRLR